MTVKKLFRFNVSVDALITSHTFEFSKEKLSKTQEMFKGRPLQVMTNGNFCSLKNEDGGKV